MSIIKRHRTYSNWRQGVYGDISPLEGEYTGVNCQVYKNGSLGPRPGWRDWTLSGENFAGAGDTVRGLLWYRDTSDNENILLLFVDATDGNLHGQLFTISGSTLTGSTDTDHTSGAGLDEAFSPGWVGKHYQWLWFDGIQNLAFANHLFDDYPSSEVTFSGQPGTFAGYVQYKDRLYAMGWDTNPGRIYYSDPGGWTTFSSTQFFDVAPDPSLEQAGVVGMWSIQNSLLIARRDGTWFVLTGASPETGSLREIAKDRVPDALGGVLVADRLHFLNQSGRGVSVATPAGIDGDSLRHLSVSRVPGYETTAHYDGYIHVWAGDGDEQERHLVLPAGGNPHSEATSVLNAVERINGAWTYSHWDIADDTSETVFMVRGRPNVIWCVIHANSTLHILSRNYTLDRPARVSQDEYSVSLTSEDFTDAGAPVMEIILGDITTPDGGFVQPTKVILDIEYWHTATFEDPDVNVDITVMGLDDDTPEVANTQVSFSGATWDSQAIAIGPGLRRRIEAPIESLPFGTAIRVKLSGDGWALHRAWVHYNEQRPIP